MPVIIVRQAWAQVHNCAYIKTGRANSWKSCGWVTLSKRAHEFHSRQSLHGRKLERKSARERDCVCACVCAWESESLEAGFELLVRSLTKPSDSSPIDSLPSKLDRSGTHARTERNYSIYMKKKIYIKNYLNQKCCESVQKSQAI